MSEAFWLNVATTLGVPTALMGAALVGYYKLSQQQLDRGEAREKAIIAEGKIREESLRQDSLLREEKMRETIRGYSQSVEKMNNLLDAVNISLVRIYNNLDRNNRIMEEILVNNNIVLVHDTDADKGASPKPVMR